MAMRKPTGLGAAVRKYDLLTAMGTLALNSAKAEQRQLLRLMVLVTARYNWASDILSIGQAEIAKLWSVDERTVKRTMSVYRAKGWLWLKRPAARGRVSQYGLGIDQLFQDSQPLWAVIGSDFEARLAPAASETNVLPFPVPAGTVPPQGQGLWAKMQRQLVDEEPALYHAWLAGLEPHQEGAGRLVLASPRRFQLAYLRTHLTNRLLQTARRHDPSIESIDFVCLADL